VGLHRLGVLLARVLPVELGQLVEGVRRRLRPRVHGDELLEELDGLRPLLPGELAPVLDHLRLHGRRQLERLRRRRDQDREYEQRHFHRSYSSSQTSGSGGQYSSVSLMSPCWNARPIVRGRYLSAEISSISFSSVLFSPMTASTLPRRARSKMCTRSVCTRISSRCASSSTRWSKLAASARVRSASAVESESSLSMR